MFGSQVLEVAIALVFVYLLVSMVCSAVREGIESKLKSRAAYLERGIRELLHDPDARGLARSFYEHPLIYGLYANSYIAKSRKQLANAIKAYTSLNAMALEKLPDEGLLVSSSCTAHVDQGTFIKILHQSSVLAKCVLRVLDSREQPFDHPYHLSFPEGRYLKFFVLQKSSY